MPHLRRLPGLGEGQEDKGEALVARESLIWKGRAWSARCCPLGLSLATLQQSVTRVRTLLP